jgi:hypothetical protein
MPSDICWVLTSNKLKKSPSYFWNCIIDAWKHIMHDLVKGEPSNLEETLRQPLLGNGSMEEEGQILGENPMGFKSIA